MEPVKLLERAAGTAAHAFRHPISSAAYAAGLARGLAGAALHGATVTEHEPSAGPRPVATQREAPARERTPLGEQGATGLKATSRASERGRGASDEEIDAWIDEAMVRGQEVEDLKAEDLKAEDLKAAALEAEPEPLIDPGTAKALRKESEMLQKGAERDPE